jgi:tRNA(Ile2) C34 agmatinyltransferase TiaS
VKTVIVIALLLGAIAVVAIEIARRWLTPRCPFCYGRDVSEFQGEYNCIACGKTWPAEK